MAQNIVFTALPAVDNKTKKFIVSAFVTIQLQTPTESSLASFPDIKDWVNKITGAKFIIRLNNTKDIKGTLIKTKLDATNYGLLFGDSIKVKNYIPQDLSVFPIKSYPIKHVTGFIEKAYKEVGNAKSDELPDEVFFTDQWKGLNEISDYSIGEVPVNPGRKKFSETDILVNKNYTKRIRSLLGQMKFIPPSNSPQPQSDFAQLKNFHSSANLNNVKPYKIPLPADFEYHDILSVLSSYPQLQRKFGLVLDIELSNADVASLGDSGTIRIIPQELDFTQATTISCPSTAFVKTPTGFFTQADANSAIEKGMLKINTPDFMVVQIDTDGAALKLCNQVDNLIQHKAKHIAMLSQAGKVISIDNQKLFENRAPKNEGLPALRSAGIGIVRNGHAAALYKKFTRANILTTALLKTPSPVPTYVGKNASFLLPSEILYADDVVQGYRMDIADFNHPEKGWLSLHRRLDTYKYNKKGTSTKTTITGIDEDEGYLQIGASQEQNGDKPLALGEVIARWEGWSLSVRRPGIAINNPGEANDVNDKNLEDNKYVLPGYIEFRLEAESKIVKGSLPKLRFGHEYNIKIRTVDLAGNSLPFNVVPENHSVAIVSRVKYRRFEPTPSPVLVQANEIKDGESLERMVIRSNKDIATTAYENSVTDKKKFLPVATRHVQAPRNTQQIAELHDMFDGIAKDKTSQQTIDYDFIDKKDLKEFINPDNEGYKTIARKVADASAKNVPLTYLADPMAAGVVFFVDSKADDSFGLAKTEAKFCSFYHDTEITETSMNTPYDKEKWRTPLSFRIELAEGKNKPKWLQEERKLIIYLDKAITTTLNYACFWRPEDVKDKSGIYSLVIENGNDGTKRNAGQSKHWMISPWRQLTLVHATQQPLLPPDIKNFKVDRHYNDTTANINSIITVDGKSTDKVNLEAEWNDYVDDFADIAPKLTKGTAHVTSLDVDYFNRALINGDGVAKDKLAERKGDAIVHQFNDTKHRWINYRGIGTTRYREYFTNLVKTTTNFSIISEGIPFKDATTDKFNKDNNQKVNLLSTARPSAPLLDYVLPSFNWAKAVKGKIETHMRTGNIRVYLKRPWFSSGEGERLGVVLTTAGEVNPVQSHYYTLWGKDPVFVAGELNNKNIPTPDQPTFPLAADYDVAVDMAELTGAKAAIAAYNILYDADRQLYYADIPINTYHAYFPFVKLALCRYQRDSLRIDQTDCCISNVIQTDWIQLVPPRTVIVAAGTDNNKFTVGVAGTSSFAGVELPTIAHNRFLKSKIRIVVENALIPKSDEAFVRTQNRQINTVILEKDFDITNAQIVAGDLKFTTQLEIDDEYKTKPYRIIVEEYEMHLADPLRQVKADSGVFGSNESSPFKERLVFMDVFEMNGSV